MDSSSDSVKVSKISVSLKVTQCDVTLSDCNISFLSTKFPIFTFSQISPLILKFQSHFRIA